MIRTRVYRNGNLEQEGYPPTETSEYLAQPDTVVWMDLCDPEDGELDLIADEFGLNPLAVEDATHERQRPKLDRYDDHLFLSLYDVELDPETCELRTSELAAFVSQRFLITVRKSGHFDIDEVVSRWDSSSDLAKHGIGYLLYGLLDVVVDGHFETVQDLDDQIEDLEDALFDESRPREREVQRRSYSLRKALVLLRRVVVPTREVVNSLMRRDLRIVDEPLMPYYQDVYDHVLRATDWTDSLRDLVTTILETNLTIQGNRMNLIMKKVTSWAAIIAVPTAVSGYYGMNVHTWPHADTFVGGVVALGLMVALSVGLYVAFRLRDWL